MALDGTPPTPDPPIYSVQAGPAGSDLVEIDWAARPYMVLVSTDQVAWTSFFTNLWPGIGYVSASSSVGTADFLDTSLVPATSSFLESEAFGRQQYKVVKSSLSAGAYLQFTFTKTNGALVVVGLTNQTAGASSTNLTQQLYNLLNASPALQGPDGVVAEDFTINSAGTVSFNLCPRSPGWLAAAIQVLPRRSGVNILPTSQGTLTQNLSDLQPRNHLYLSAGATTLAVTSSLDTSTLADGYHDLTAVAYEGSSVHTQTPITLPVQVHNSPLNASLTLLDLTNMAPVQGTYHLQVAANTNNVSVIRLCTTGGVFNSITNQSTNTFILNGSALGAGLHPFYALVETTNGLKYRTQVQWVRLVNGP